MRWISRLQASFPFLFVLLAFVGMLTSQRAAAQATTGSIYGRVTDPSQAVVPGAQITAIGETTGVKYPGESDSDGNYTIHGLPPGTYSVEVKRDGFKSESIKDVLLTIDQKQLLNFELKVGTD